jgi:hypothetical protein
MIKLLRLLLFGFGALCLLAIVIGLLMPKSWQVERSRVIAATPADVHARLADARGWSEWMPWLRTNDPALAFRDSSLRIEPIGPPTGAGAGVAVKSELVGGFTMTITASTPERVDFVLQGAGAEQATHGSVSLKPQGAGTHVTWSQSGELAWNPLLRFFRPLYQLKLGRDFEATLAALERASTRAP